MLVYRVYKPKQHCDYESCHHERIQNTFDPEFVNMCQTIITQASVNSNTLAGSKTLNLTHSDGSYKVLMSQFF